MGKTKIKKENITNIQQETLQSKIPDIFIYLFLGLWFYIVISNYYKIYPLQINLINWFFSYDRNLFSFSSLFKVWIDYFLCFFVLFLILIAGYSIGKLLLNKLNIGFIENIFFSTGLGLGCLSIITFFVGISGFLYKSIILSIILFFDFFGIYLFLKERKKIKQQKKSEQKYNYTLIEKICILIIIISGFINLLGCLVPETFFDSQFYHLGIPTYWIQNHKIISIPYIHQSNYPFNIQLLYTISLILKNDIVAQLLHFSFEFFIIFGMIILSKKYFSRKIGIISAMIYCTVPNVNVVSWKTAIEIGLGFFEFLSVFSLINYYFDKQNDKRKISWLILSGVFCGFALGGKYTSISCLISLFFAVFLKNVFDKVKIKFILKEIFILTVCSLIIFSPWLIKNYINKKNPFFPFSWKGNKFIYLQVREGKFPIGDPAYFPLNPENILTIPWNLTMNKKLKLGTKELGVTVQESYPGGVLLLLLPFVFLFHKRISPVIKLLIFYLSVYIILWIGLGKAYLRYFVPGISILSLIFGYFLLYADIKFYIKNLLIGIVIFMCFTNIFYTMYIQKLIRDPLNVILGIETPDEYLSTQRPSYPNPYYPAVKWINNNLSQNTKILILGDTRSAFLKRNFVVNGPGELSPIVELCSKSKDCDQLYEKLKQEGITHILLNVPEARRLAGYKLFYFEPKDFKIFIDFWNKYIKEIYRDIADISLPEKDIYSIKKQVPDWWKGYSSDIHNYIYLYEILSSEQANKIHSVPYNFFLEPHFYDSERQKILGLS